MTTRSSVLQWGDPIQAHPDWNAPDDVAIWIDVLKLDEAWRLDEGFYIGAGGSGPAIDNRYEGFGRWLASSSCRIELPMVAIEDKVVSFSDGRHRFAWLRDHGVRAIPVQVSAEQAGEFEIRFGATERKSIVTW